LKVARVLSKKMETVPMNLNNKTNEKSDIVLIFPDDLSEVQKKKSYLILGKVYDAANDCHGHGYHLLLDEQHVS
jgi:hypothetical protein